MGRGNGKQGPPGSERREHERVPVDLRVDYRSEDTFLFASITNISEMGIFIETRAPLPRGTQLNLEFELPTGGRFSERGEVMWVNPYRPEGPNLNPGMGVRFLELSGEARSKIVELVRKIAYLDDDEESGGPVGQA
ncbi:MAG TPA: TIGR02266 family protein [Myxococcota bacterium]|jgi:type IV pilus assembly protein PilZ|nr:TIGR02266 family protein [Myxococcota bacterium]